MPTITDLAIKSFRNMDSVSISPGPEINLVFGPNGAGKTSLLEAISVLAHGRSFRTHKFRRLIKTEQPEFTLFGKVLENEEASVMGVRRSRSGESLFRIDGRTVYASGELAAKLPLQIIDAHSFSLIEGSATVRRHFFDWLVFHVEHEFHQAWKNYTRCIKQRNSLLRHDKITYTLVDPWDREIAHLGKKINQLRQNTFYQFEKELLNRVEELDFGIDDKVFVSYIDGWRADTNEDQPSEDSFLERLRNSFNRDKKVGYTTIGAHKSDIKITLGNIPVSEVLSRGQQKVLIAAMFIAEATVFHQMTNRRAVFLLDDMPAELDTKRLEYLGGWLNQLKTQIFITGIEAENLVSIWPQIEDKTVAKFHVEQGAVMA